MNNTANALEISRREYYSSSSSSSTTALDFFRDDVALGFLTVACFVGAGRYDVSDCEKWDLQCANLSLLAGRLVRVIFIFILYLSEFLRKILARGFGLILMGNKQTQDDVALHKVMIF